MCVCVCVCVCEREKERERERERERESVCVCKEVVLPAIAGAQPLVSSSLLTRETRPGSGQRRLGARSAPRFGLRRRVPTPRPAPLRIRGRKEGVGGRKEKGREGWEKVRESRAGRF